MKALFNSVYEKYHHDLYNFVFYMVKNKSLTEDLVQEIYIRIFKSYDSFRGEASEKTWAFSIARNVIFDYFRKEKRKRNYTNETVDWDEMASFVSVEQKLPDELVIEHEDTQLIYRLLDECSLNQKQVIILRFIQGFSLQETAEMLDMTLSNVKTLQHRGINKLKTLLQDEKREGGMKDG